MKNLKKFLGIAVLITVIGFSFTACLLGDDNINGGSGLSTPRNLTARTVSSSEIDLDWSSVSGAAGYYIYESYSSSSGFVKLNGYVTTPGATIYDLDPGTTYYFRVTAYDLSGRESNQSSSASATTSGGGGGGNYTVGDIGPAGGYIFYDKGFFSSGWQYLEAAPPNTELIIAWGPSMNAGSTALVVGSGKQNTDLIIDAFGANDSAAKSCANLNVGGYRDWFMPSSDELYQMYDKLKRLGKGGFTDSNYWSSSQSSGNTYAYCYNFGNGSRSSTTKGNVFYVRAVRSF